MLQELNYPRAWNYYLSTRFVVGGINNKSIDNSPWWQKRKKKEGQKRRKCAQSPAVGWSWSTHRRGGGLPGGGAGRRGGCNPAEDPPLAPSPGQGPSVTQAADESGHDTPESFPHGRQAQRQRQPWRHTAGCSHMSQASALSGAKAPPKAALGPSSPSCLPSPP